MDYAQILEHIEAKKGNNHSRQVLKKWMEKDFPDQSIPGVQIAGTNGKGSVSMWIFLILEQLGFSVGLFTSPHLVEHTERIHFKGDQIPRSDFVEIYNKYHDFFEKENFNMFETDLWIALEWFRRKKPDFIVWETGLGGRKDAVSTLDLQWAVITGIDLDHQALLGDSREQIALEKAGLIRDHRPPMTVIMAERERNLVSIFEREAEKHGASISGVETVCFPESVRNKLPAYQLENLQTALHFVRELGFHPSWKEMEEVVSRFEWPARFQILRKEPLLILDGAHNPQGIRALVDSIKKKGFRIDRIFFSVLADKEADAMIRDLEKLEAQVVLVDFHHQRMADLEKIAERKLAVCSMRECLDFIRSAGKPVLCCGSLYFTGELLKHLKTRE